MTTDERTLPPGTGTTPDAWAVHMHLVNHLGMPVGMVEIPEATTPRHHGKRSKIDVALFSPMGPGSTSLLVTVGGCNKVMPNTRFAELLLLCRPAPSKDGLLDLALLLKRLVRTPWEHGTNLQPGVKLPLEDPPALLAAFSHVVVLEPRTFKPGFASIQFKGHRKAVDILWLVPLHPEENGYADRHGANALYEQWAALQVDLASLSRPPAPLPP